MKRWGIYLVILGIGSFLLPMLGLQFKILMIFGEAAPAIGGLLIFAGIAMIIGGTISEKKRVQSFAGKTGDVSMAGAGSTPGTTPGAAPGLRCYACKAIISETDMVCPKCQTPL